MVRVATIDDPALVSYLTAMLSGEDIAVRLHDRTLGNPYAPRTRYELYVAEADAVQARALLRQLKIEPDAIDG